MGDVETKKEVDLCVKHSPNGILEPGLKLPVLQLEEGHCAKVLLGGIGKHRRGKPKFCDVKIKVGRKTFPAHKIVLASLSPFFAKRIMDDAKTDCIIPIAGTKADIFEIILDYAYSRSITITEANAEALLRTSCYLEVHQLTNVCEYFLGRNVKSDNFLRLIELARVHSCSVLSTSVYNFILRNFSVTCWQDEFLELKFESFLDIITSDELSVPNEEIVFDAVMRWINHKKDRKSYLLKLLSHVRLALLSADSLNKRLQEEEIIRTSAECVYLFSQVLMLKFQPDSQSDVQVSAAFARPRKANTILSQITSTAVTEYGVEVVLIGEKARSPAVGFSKPLCFLNIEDGTLRQLRLPFPENHTVKGADLLGNLMYILSDNSSFCEDDNAITESSIWLCDFLSGAWKIIDNAVGPPSCGGLFEVDGYLFVSTIINHDYTVLQQYDLELKVWTVLASMTELVQRPVLLRVGKLIYALGGAIKRQRDGENVTFYVPTVQRYNPNTNKWTKVAPLLEAKEKLLGCVFEEKIYVFDGTQDNTEATVMKPQVYDPSRNKWEWGAALNKVYRCPAALEVINGVLTFVDVSRFPYLQIERFSPDRNFWEVCRKQVKINPIFDQKSFHFFSGFVRVKPF